MGMEAGGQLMGEKRDAMGLARLGGLHDDAGILGERRIRSALALVVESGKVGAGERGGREIEIGKDRLRLPEHAAPRAWAYWT